MSELVIIVPILKRAHRVAPLVASIAPTVPSGTLVLFMTTPGDSLVDAAVSQARDGVAVERARGAGRLRVELARVPWAPVGDYARKINAGYKATDQPLIFLGADDLDFHPGWFDACCEMLGAGIGVVGTNDMGNPRTVAGDHSTHSLVTRAYADEWGTVDSPGAILCELYPHEYVDDELVGTARHRNAYAHAYAAEVEHLHPNWGKAPNDDMYQEQRQRMRRGAALYRSRVKLWT